MTTLFRKKLSCAICGAESEQIKIGHTKDVGSSDLDSRPPPMRRLTIEYWVQECPRCGYCSGRIDQGSKVQQQIIESEPYRTQLESTELPRLANRFLCQSLLMTRSGEVMESIWGIIQAAWVCDDAHQDTAAKELRRKAAEQLVSDTGPQSMMSDQRGAGRALAVDLLRRAGDFDQARTQCEEGLQQNPDETIEKMLRFQTSLIEARDGETHTVAEAFGESTGEGGCGPCGCG